MVTDWVSAQAPLATAAMTVTTRAVSGTTIPALKSKESTIMSVGRTRKVVSKASAIGSGVRARTVRLQTTVSGMREGTTRLSTSR